MPKPTLKLSPTGLIIAKQTLILAGLTQKDLCTAVGCSRQPMTNFFKGSAIAQPLFMAICERLQLDWQKIAEMSVSVQVVPAESSEIGALVQRWRQRIHDSVQARCGTMRILEMTQPVGLDEIYANVNVLEQLTGRRRKRLAELLEELQGADFERLSLGPVDQERIPGLKAVQQFQKLIVLGKPGAGKTTFLKYLAIRCNQGAWECDRLPIFVTLKDFAEAPDQPRLLEYISRRDLNSYGSPSETKLEAQWLAEMDQVLQAGRGLVLLDGLDEVRSEDHERVLTELRTFAEQYRDNAFVMTCRVAAWEYTFEQFTEVEVADFDETQIAHFARQWFRSQPRSAAVFLKCLQRNQRVQEIATNPLLLTLLCLAFESSGELPGNRSDLYREGIDTLLKKWDVSRGIYRDQIYQKLSHQRKKDLLSQIAIDEFKQGRYFFTKMSVESYITAYIRNFADASADPIALQLDSEAVLQSIESQHGLLMERAKGIYSFSHLTFHEYFTARQIVFREPDRMEALQGLITHISERRWHEIFILVTEMLPDASILLLQIQTWLWQFVGDRPWLQQFLQAVGDRAKAPDLQFLNQAAVRAFLFDIDFEIDPQRRLAVSLDPKVNLLVCASFWTRMLQLSWTDAIQLAQTEAEEILKTTSANEAMLLAIRVAACKSPDRQQRNRLVQWLARVEDQPDDAALEQVSDEARQVAKDRQHLGGNWGEAQFSALEKQELRQYYRVTRLLVDCLKSDAWIPEPTRLLLEQGILMPL